MLNQRIATWPLLLTLAVAVTVGGCTSGTSGTSSPSGQPGPSGGQGQAAPAGLEKSVTIPWNADIGHLNPHLYAPSQMFAQAMVYESLVDYTEDGQIAPRLAEKWEVSPDGLSYVFHLRKDVVFSDGTAFKADNVKRNVDAIMANKERHSWMGIVSVLKETEKLDDYTVRLTLNKPYYPLLQELAFVRPFRFLGDAGFPDSGKTSETIQKPVGTGPWVLAEYKKDEYAVFRRNEQYWGTKPKLSSVKVRIIPDPETIVSAFEKKELDMIVGSGIISMDSFKYLKDSGKYGTGASRPLTTRTFIMNSVKAPTSEAAVRQAVQHGIDKEKMVKSVTLGLEEKADTVMARNFPYSDLGLKPYGYDPAHAVRLLEDAGWKLPAGKTVREKDGKPLVLDLVYVSTDAIQKPMAEIIQAELAKIGMQVNVKGEELMVGNSRLKSGDYHLNFWNTYGVPNDPHNFVTSGIQAKTGIHEALLGIPAKARIDGMGQEILNGADENRRRELYRSFLTEIHDSAVFYPISYDAMTAVHHKKLTGLKFGGTKYDFPFGQLDTAP